ncbi:MAG: hypothetical protein II534_05015 [Clostridia bacterium]|nr:hypothetical protein [Clostridia bacterium]
MNGVIDFDNGGKRRETGSRGVRGIAAGRGAGLSGDGRRMMCEKPVHSSERIMNFLCSLIAFFEKPAVKVALFAVTAAAAAVCFVLFAASLVSGSMSLGKGLVAAPLIVVLFGITAKLLA